MKYVTAILLAAGKGARLRSRISKPLVEINSKPVILYSLIKLNKHPFVRDIIIAANKKNSQSIINLIKRFRVNKVRAVVSGGLRRQDSVYCALKAIDCRTDTVLIHDAVRPFLNNKMISALIKEARVKGAAITGVPVKATVKQAAGTRVTKTLNRNNLWEVQTPQVFGKDLIQEAYRRFLKTDVTDDSALVEKLGKRVSIILGSYDNIKITTPEDLVIAKAIARKVNR